MSVRGVSPDASHALGLGGSAKLAARFRKPNRLVRLLAGVVLSLGTALAAAHPAWGADETGEKPVNVATNSPGQLPMDQQGKSLNTDFEKGTLEDWTAEGKAFEQQPIRGPIDPKRPFGAGKRSDHTGEFWIGGGA